MDNETLQLVISSIVAPGVLYMGKVIFDFTMKKATKSDTLPIEGMVESPPLGQHAFFERMKYLENHIRYCFSIQNKGKELIFKDILSHYVEVYVSHLSKLVEQDFSNLDSIQLSNLMMKCLDSATIDFNSYYKNSSYTLDEQKILDLIMVKFNRWHHNKTEHMYRSVEMVCNSKFYGSSPVKVSVVLDLLLGSFVDTVNDAEATLNELNGDLKGLVYKNIKL